METIARITPRSQKFKELYLNPKSETYGNAYQSAIRAGYSSSYAKSITAPAVGNQWVKDIKEVRLSAINKAERRLEAFISDSDKRVSLEASKFIAKTLGRDVYHEKSETEHSGTIALGVVVLPRKNINQESVLTPIQEPKMIQDSTEKTEGS